MRAVFADTLYWVATARPSDPWRRAADRARRDLGPALLVTTDEILTEFLTAMSRGGPGSRRRAVRTVHAILASPRVRVVPQSRDTFLRALERYERREDKSYSLADYSSMNTMDAEKITDVLTNDHHFEQDGYTVLMRK